VKGKARVWLLLLVVAGVVVYYATLGRPHGLVLTGIVTTDQVIVSSEIQGRLQELSVKEGDEVKAGQLLGTIKPQEWKADMAFFASSEKQSAAQVTVARADLKYQESQTTNQIRQAEANLAATQAQVTQAEADLENAKLNFQRMEGLYHNGVEAVQSYDQTRTAFASATARVDSLKKQVEAARAAVALAEASGDQIAAREAAVVASEQQLAAQGAQRDKAKVHLDYTEIHAPIAGVVDVRAALPGEVVNPGQGIVTLIDPDNLWVRADVEETYIDRIQLDEKLTVRLPSGEEREGTVIYRGADAEFATQRDVSRTKRDIKTFQFRLRCDNHDRKLAVGMTAYVTVPLNGK